MIYARKVSQVVQGEQKPPLGVQFSRFWLEQRMLPELNVSRSTMLEKIEGFVKGLPLGVSLWV